MIGYAEKTTGMAEICQFNSGRKSTGKVRKSIRKHGNPPFLFRGHAKPGYAGTDNPPFRGDIVPAPDASRISA